MAYNFDVFLSYRRFMEWPKWVEDRFLPLFRHYLGEELGRSANIFIDTKEIETGVAWPFKLAEGLSQSKVLVCLWSRQYFNSDWCLAELSHMRAREKACGLGTAEHPGGLIVPVIGHDGDDFPAAIRHIQAYHFQDVVNFRMAAGSAIDEALSRKIEQWVPNVKAAIERAPAFDPQWRDAATDDLLAALRRSTSQKSLPTLGAL
jgi:hypothetical protein